MSRRRGGSPPTPVVLPRIIVDSGIPGDAGTVVVTLDGQPVCDAAVPRVQLGEAISQIIDQLGTPVRLEVHEPDATVHADILSPPSGHRDAERMMSDMTSIMESA